MPFSRRIIIAVSALLVVLFGVSQFTDLHFALPNLLAFSRRGTVCVGWGFGDPEAAYAILRLMTSSRSYFSAPSFFNVLGGGMFFIPWYFVCIAWATIAAPAWMRSRNLKQPPGQKPPGQKPPGPPVMITVRRLIAYPTLLLLGLFVACQFMGIGFTLFNVKITCFCSYIFVAWGDPGRIVFSVDQIANPNYFELPIVERHDPSVVFASVPWWTIFATWALVALPVWLLWGRMRKEQAGAFAIQPSRAEK